MNPIWKPSHPIWKMLRLVIVALIMFLFATFFYKNGLDTKDLIAIGVTIASLAGYDQAKAIVTKTEE